MANLSGVKGSMFNINQGQNLIKIQAPKKYVKYS